MINKQTKLIDGQALDAWLDKQHKVSRALGEPDRASAYWHVKHEIQSGRFDSPSDDRLRAVLELAMPIVEHQSPTRAEMIREALSASTTEQTGVERVRELWALNTEEGNRADEEYLAGIVDTLNALGITIPGINAPEKEAYHANS